MIKPGQKSTNDAVIAAAIQPLSLRSRLLAAWDAGQLLNESYFHLRQAVLLPLPLCRELRGLFEQRLAELALVARETVDAPVRQDELGDEIRRELNAWKKELTSEQFAEDWLNTFRDLGMKLQGCCESTLHEVRRDACDTLLRSVEASRERLRQAIESSFDESQLRAFRLSELLDQALRPADVLGEMYPAVASELGATPAGNQVFEEVGIPFGGTQSMAREARPLEHCPSQAISQTAFPPGDGWHVEICQRWLQVGLPPAELPAVSAPSNGQALKAFVEAANNVGRSSLGHTVQSASEVTPVGEGVSIQNASRIKPNWNPKEKILMLAGRVIANLSNQSGRFPQLQLLDAFQEADWAKTIDNPFKDHFGIPDKMQLRETVDTFNRSKKAEWIRLSTAGGEFVSWNLVSETAL